MHRRTRLPVNCRLLALILVSGHAISLNKNVRLSTKLERKKSEPPLSILFSLPPLFIFSVQMTLLRRRVSMGYKVDNDHLKILMLIDTTEYSLSYFLLLYY